MEKYNDGNSQIKESKLKECFANQARILLYGDPPDECAECDLFEKCHKMTVSVALQSIAGDLDLITQNGLATGKLMAFKELSEYRKRKKGKK
jgi:hypothetical protein